MSGYIGTQPVPQTTQTRDSFTATSNQTSFPTSGYTPNYLDVFLNGVKLAAADYTATNNSDVVLAVGAATGDILEVVAYSTFNAANVTGAVDFTVTGDITVNGTVDGVDIAARDAVLTSTTTTANAALPKSGGTMTGALTVDGAYSYLNGLRISGVDTGNTIYQPTSDLSISSASGSISLKPSGTNVLHATNTGVGIGTSSPSSFTGYTNVTLKGGSNGSNLDFHNSSGTRVGAIVSNPGTELIVETGEATPLVFKTNSSERMRIGSTGIIYVNGDGTGGRISGDGSGGLNLQDGNGRQTFKIMSPASGSTQALTLDASGNLLVGTTSSNYGVVGSQIGTGGNNYMTRSGAQPLLLNRLSSDGDILLLMKDGSTVGSIGVVNANNMYLSGSASNHAGVQFGTQNVTPYNNGSQSDGAVDLGASNLRWKDAYFSGGVTSSKPQGGTAFHASTAGSYIQVDGSSSSAMAFGMTGGNGSPATAASTSLGFHHWNNSSWANPVNITRDGIAFNGDTAAANALNDYEEGTWTATGNGITLADQVCSYVKVGNIVHIGAKVVFPTTSSTGNSSITLPFASVNSQASRSGISIGFHTAGSSYYGLQFLVSTDAADGVFYIGSTLITNANLSGKTVFFGGTYLSDN